MAQNETLELLLEVCRLLSSKLELGSLLKTVLELSTRVVGSESASLLLLDEKSRELYFDVALGLGPEAAAVRLKLGQGIAGAVAQERKPAIINDARADKRWSPAMDRQTGFTTRSILAAPMIIKGKLIGVVEAINKIDGDFSAEDLRAFEAFASQAAIAIDNARLFQSVQEEKRTLDAVFSEMADGALMTDEQGQILFANAAARGYLGLGGAPGNLAQALAGMAVVPPLSSPADSNGGREITATRREPKTLILSGRARRARAGWLWIFRDETESRQKEALKRTFLSLISHKLRTPLSSVTGFAEVLLADLSKTLDAKSLKALETILAQGQKLSELVDKLLRYVTLESPEDTVELAPCELDLIVTRALKAMAPWLSARSAVVDYQAAPGLVVIGDQNHLGELVSNLVENAVKFDATPSKKVAVAAGADGRFATLRVKDNGGGIPPEDQEKVFSLFHQIEASFTGQVDGWGLGLPFVKKVALGHGGRVELDSKLGQGTTVTVFLPRKNP